MSNQIPTPGRSVRHVSPDGAVRPAVVIATDGTRADLHVLQPTHRGVLLSPKKEGNTFHFPEIPNTAMKTPAPKPLPIKTKGGKGK